MSKTVVTIPAERVEKAILQIRGERVILDSALAELYCVETRSLIQAVKRNRDRFPPDFVFQLTPQEFESLRSQYVISKGKGGRRYAPYAFSEHNASMKAMLAVYIDITLNDETCL